MKVKAKNSRSIRGRPIEFKAMSWFSCLETSSLRSISTAVTGFFCLPFVLRLSCAEDSQTLLFNAYSFPGVEIMKSILFFKTLPDALTTTCQ